MTHASSSPVRAPLDRIDDELRRIASTRPGFRTQQLGGSARAILEHIQSGVIDRETARDDLIMAARQTGLSDREIASTIRWAWGEAEHPKYQAHPLADSTPDHVVDLARNFNLPDDTVEYPTGAFLFATSIKGLVDAIDHVDPTAFDRPTDDPWKTPEAHMRRFHDLYDFHDLATGRMATAFANGDRDAMGNAAAEIVVQAVMIADRFGVPLGKYVARYVDGIAAERSLSVAVADQASS